MTIINTCDKKSNLTTPNCKQRCVFKAFLKVIIKGRSFQYFEADTVNVTG